jgi:hypothetical protein
VDDRLIRKIHRDGASRVDPWMEVLLDPWMDTTERVGQGSGLQQTPGRVSLRAACRSPPGSGELVRPVAQPGGLLHAPHGLGPSGDL